MEQTAQPEDCEANAQSSEPTSAGENDTQGQAAEDSKSSERSASFEGVEFRAETANIKDSTFAKEVYQEYHTHFSDSGGKSAVLLSPKNFERHGSDLLSQRWDSSISDPATIEVLTEHMETKRVLVLAGEPETGKTNLSLLVAARLLHRQLSEGALLSRELDSRVRVDRQALIGEEKSYDKHVLILQDALSKSPDMARLAERLTESELATWRSRLHERQSFLIITASDVTALRQRMHGLGILQDAPTPSNTMLVKLLRRKGREIREDLRFTGSDDRDTVLEEFLNEQGEQIAGKLKTFPRVDRFVREYLLGVITGRLTLEQALERMDDPTCWLLTELPHDPDTFYRVVALTLCSAASLPESVPWLAFEMLRRHIAKLFQRETRQSQLDRKLQDTFRRIEDLEKMKAKMLSSGTAPHEGITFVETTQAERLWEALIGPGRELLALMLPLLRELTANDDFHLREIAARALGKLGQIDPPYVTYPLISSHSVSLGPLFQGVLSTKSSAYRQHCLTKLRTALRSNESAVASRALRSLPQIADLDLSLAFQELKSLALDKLEIQWQEVRKSCENLREEEEIVRANAPQGSIHLQIKKIHEHAELILASKLVIEWRLLLSYQSALARLFLISPDERTLLLSVQQWMMSAPEKLGPLVSYLFLHKFGAAPFLTEYSLQTSKSEENGQSPLLLAAQVDPETALALQRFLQEVFAHTRAFPGLFRQLLEKRFRELLGAWASEAKRTRSLRSVIASLLSSLFEADDRELSDWILHLAQDPLTPDGLADLKSLALEALTRRPAN